MGLADAGLRQHALDAFGGGSIPGHLDRITRSIAVADAQRREQFPLLQHRMLRRKVGRARDDVAVHPGASARPIADTHRRRARPHEPRTPRTAVQVDGHVELRAPQSSGKREILTQSADSGISRNNDYVVQVGIPVDDRGGCRFDDVGEMGVRIAPLQRAHQRRGEHDIAKQAKAYQKDLHWCEAPGTSPSPPWPHRSASQGCRP